jgi:PAS domain S-box-containing protein
MSIAPLIGTVDAPVSEEIVRLAVEDAPSGMIVTDSGGTIVLVNAEVERLFGYRREELLGKSVDVLVPPAVRAAHHGHYKGFAAESKERHLGVGRDLHGVRKDGTEVPIEIGLKVLRVGAGRMILSVMTEITQRKRADERLRLLIEACPCGMIMTDADGAIVLVNAEIDRLFGYASGELLGKSIELLIPAPVRAGHGQYRANLVERPVARRMGIGRAVQGLRKDGALIPVEIGLNTVRTSEGTMILSAIIDISERQSAEEALQQLQIRMLEGARQEKQEAQAVARRIERANKELEELAYAASHDLKAPLRVIDNVSKWLQEDLSRHLIGENGENMNLLRGRIGRMEKLLDDLLEYLSIGRANRRHAEVVAGDALMDGVLALLSPREGFTVNVSPGFADIRVHSVPLQQILLNLVGNAIKHHDKNHGHIEATVEDRGTHYAFAVADDGPGIPAQFHDQIFKIFQTLRPRDQVEGSGMGLAIVRKLIDVYGGTLALDSVEGRGSIFRFTWPKRQQMREFGA